MSEHAINFACRLPDVSGGLVISDMVQRTRWDFDYNREQAQIAALLPGPWNPTLAARQIATISQLSNARNAVNVVIQKAVEFFGREAIPRVRELERQLQPGRRHG